MVATIKFTYKAKEGERVDQISHKFFGSSIYVQDIYELNPTLLNTSSLLLTGGTLINIPNITVSRRDKGLYSVFD